MSPEDVDARFGLADLGVRAGLAGDDPPRVERDALAPALREPRGVFVTLEVDGALNGCIGSIVGTQPVGAAVPELAWRAAFADPRLPPCGRRSTRGWRIKLSLIGPLVPLAAGSVAELAAELRPGRDGVLVHWGAANATFLPAVWSKLPDPVTFPRQLWAKAGLHPGQWPPGTEAWRYETVEHRRTVAEIAVPTTTPPPR